MFAAQSLGLHNHATKRYAPRDGETTKAQPPRGSVGPVSATSISAKQEGREMVETKSEHRRVPLSATNLEYSSWGGSSKLLRGAEKRISLHWGQRGYYLAGTLRVC